MGATPWTSMSSAFYGCENLRVNAFDAPDLSLTTSLDSMFMQCVLFNDNINHWDISNITSMRSLFRSFNTTNNQPNGTYNQPLNSWNTSNIIRMDYMFAGQKNFNQNINTWDVSKVTNTSYMFDCAGGTVDWVLDAKGVFNSPLNLWNTSSLVSMVRMFHGQSFFNQDLSSWNTENVTNMSGVFKYCPVFNQPLSSWNVSAVTNMSSMFDNANNNRMGSFNQPIDNWDVSNVTTINGMFINTRFNQPLNSWNTSNVTDMRNVFNGYYQHIFNQDISNWNTSKVTDMSQMFWNSRFNQDISGWNVSAVTTMRSMFYYATSFNQDISSWNTSNVTDMSNMFGTTVSFNQNIGSWTLNPSVNMSGMLNNCGMSCTNYSNTLAGWHAGNPTVTTRSLGASGKKYGSSVFTSERANLVLPTANGGRGWTISGDALYSLNPVLVSSGTSKTLTNTSCNSSIYENPTILTQKMLNIDVNGNSSFSATNVTINHNNIGVLPSGITSQNGYYQKSDYGHTMRISNRLTTIEAPGTHSTNGGIRVRVYYLASEHTNMTNNAVPVGGSIVQSGWFKSSYHDAAQVVADMQGGETNLPSAIEITPTSSGTEGGIAYAEFVLETFSTIGFFAKTNSSTLPIDLLSFDGKCKNNEVKLTWQTASEKNNEYFTIERSLDTEHWEIVGTKKGAGNSNEVHSYLLSDPNPLDKAYYHLKQTDINGDFEYSKPIYVNCAQEQDVNPLIYPNPSLGLVTIQNVLVGQKIALFNQLGQVLYHGIVTSSPMNLDFGYLPKGVYFVELSDEHQNFRQKVVLE